jgi:hypothetical protein
MNENYEMSQKGVEEETESGIEITPEEMKKAVSDYHEKKTELNPVKEQIRKELKDEGEEVDEGILQEIAESLMEKKRVEKTEEELKKTAEEKEKCEEWKNLHDSIDQAINNSGDYKYYTKFDALDDALDRINNIDRKFGEYIPEKKLLEEMIKSFETILKQFEEGVVKNAIIKQSQKWKWNEKEKERGTKQLNAKKQNLEKKVARAKERRTELEEEETESK